jgi:CIC family chloride channel protein
MRRGELGIIGLAIVAGALSGLIASGLGSAAHLVQVLFFGEGAAYGLSAIRDADPWLLLLGPLTGGLLLAGLNWLLARWWSRSPVDPIEANALHGGHMSLRDGVVVASQNLVSNGFGTSVGLEAAYAQVGGGLASKVGGWFSLRRGDLRILVGSGAAGAIAAAFGAPLTGAFYAFELVIGTYAIASLVPVTAAAISGVLVAGLIRDVGPQVPPGGIGTTDAGDLALSLLLGLLCGLAGIALMRGVSLAEQVWRRVVPWTALRPAAGSFGVGLLALLTPMVLSGGHGALHLVLSTEMTVGALLVLLVLKVLAVSLSIGAGFRGGLFFASLLLGAVVGKILAVGTALWAPPGADPMLLSIVGMSAFGAAVIGGPLAMTFLALETTRDFTVAGPVLIAVMTSATVVRRLFGYSFTTWRFHLRGEAIRGPHDIGWLRDLTVGRMMRRNDRTVQIDTRLSSFVREFPLGSVSRVVVVDEASRYAGIVLVPEAHAADPATDTVEPLLRLRDRALLPPMNAKQAMALFEAAEAEALVVLDGAETRKVVGVLTEAHLLRRYGEELNKRRHEEAGLATQN